jgi:hypothetical protein
MKGIEYQKKKKIVTSSPGLKTANKAHVMA